MDYVRVSGVCLLLLMIAAALPIGGLAEAQNGMGGSGLANSASSGSAVPVVSGNFLSGGSQPTGSPVEITAPSNAFSHKVDTGTSPQGGSNSAETSGSTGSSTPAESTSASAPVTEYTIPPASQPVGQPQSMPASQPSSGSSTPAENTGASAPVTEYTIPPASQPISEPVSQPVSEPVSQPVSRPVEPATPASPQPENVVTSASTAAAATSVADINNASAKENVITPDMIPAANATDNSSSQANNTTTVVIPSAGNISQPNGTTNASTVNATSENISQPENVTSTAVPAENQSNQTSGNIETTSAPVESTDRIWREGISPPDYTWTPQSFSGFFYDLDKEVGTEKMTVHLTQEGSSYSRSIAEHDLKYSSNVQPIEFKFAEWGTYQVLGFMADKYFAGYLENSNQVVDRDISLINEGQLRKVLIDSDTEQTLTTGSVLELADGYELKIKEIDTEGNKAYLALTKDGATVDSKVINPLDIRTATYTYTQEISGQKTPIIMAHINNVFASAESGLATIDGLFQIADTYTSVEDGDEYGKMKVVSVSDAGISMDNTNSISLGRNKVVNIFGNVSFQIADSSVLRFAPIVQRTGNYEVRGTVVIPSKISQFTWTPYNFEGFYYNIDDDVGSETMTATFSGASIDEKNLVYEAKPQPIKFKFENWGKYDVIGFLADKYFAGYDNATDFTKEVSAINEGELRKVLIDSDDEQTIASGSALSLGEGYELRIKQVDLNGNKVYLALAKDGKEVDSKVVTPSTDVRASNYMYKVTVGSTTDVPIITAHVQSVFKGTEADLATVDGLFQVSDAPTNVEEGQVFDKMKVDSLSDAGITMKNDDSTISLGRGRTVAIMGNLKFQVADSDDRALAPIAERTGEGKTLSINVSSAVVNQPVTIQVTQSSLAIANAQVSVNGNSIGITDATGFITYTPTSVGTFDVTATKAGYSAGTATLNVMSAAGAAAAANVSVTPALSINAPSDVLKGEKFLITITGGENQTAISNSTISFDESAIGTTDNQGTLTYSTNLTGTHQIKAEKTGYIQATKDIVVSSPIQVISINVPKTASTGQTVTVSANVRNVGTIQDNRTLNLTADGNVTDAKNVVLGPGDNVTEAFTFKPKDPGVYRMSIDNQEGTVTVEKAQTNWTLIAVVLILLIVIGAGAYLYRTGELENLRKRLQKR